MPPLGRLELLLALLAGTFQIKKICFLKRTVFPLCQIGGKVASGQMDQCMVKVRNMLEVYDKAAVRLEKAISWKDFLPIMHIVDRFKIPYCRMDDDFSPQSFYRYNGGCRKRVYALFRFHRNLDSHGIVQADRLFHVAEKAPDIQRFGQIAEYMETHGVVQVFGIRGRGDRGL